jgi:hypothetical protein
MRHEFSRVPGNTGRTDLDKCDKILAQRIEAKRANDYEVAVRSRPLQPARPPAARPPQAAPNLSVAARELRARAAHPPPCPTLYPAPPCSTLHPAPPSTLPHPPPCPTLHPAPAHASCSRQDKLRDQLRRDLGVEVMDRERLWWSVNGERGQMPQFKASSHDYRREDNLDGVDIESINAILAQRLQARLAPP